MTSDEARDLFVDAVEGTLDPAQQAELDAAIAADPELCEELDAYRSVIRGASGLGLAAVEGTPTEPTPDLLSGVQNRLRVRSRGRFYRDKYAQDSGGRATVPILAILMTALLLATGWFAMQSIVVIESSEQNDGR